MSITYCVSDEAPAVAWYSLSPIVIGFARALEVDINEIDISLAQLVCAEHARNVDSTTEVIDPRNELQALIDIPGHVIVKAPSISANPAQLNTLVLELQRQRTNLSQRTISPHAKSESFSIEKNHAVLGSVINKILRQGSMVRELAGLSGISSPIETFEVNHNRSFSNKAHVSTMSRGDFRSTEIAKTAESDIELNIVLSVQSGQRICLAKGISTTADDILAFSVMTELDLTAFVAKELKHAFEHDLVFSLQLKSNVLKEADSYVFEKTAALFYPRVFQAFGKQLKAHGIDPAMGLAGIQSLGSNVLDPPLFDRLVRADEFDRPDPGTDKQVRDKTLPVSGVPGIARAIADAIMQGCYTSGRNGRRKSIKFVIPDSAHAGFYATVLDEFKQHGLPSAEHVQNISLVGLTMQSAEEYGSNKTTFPIPESGVVHVEDNDGNILSQHRVVGGDIWRLMLTTNKAIEDWIDTAFREAQAKNWPLVFWLDRTRPYHKEVIKKLRSASSKVDTREIEVHILSISDATSFTLRRLRHGQGVVVAIGNLLRDYLSELIFAIAGQRKQLVRSHCQLESGARLIEVGTGGTAPLVYQYFRKHNFLRWNSISEIVAFAQAFRYMADFEGNDSASQLANSLEIAIGRLFAKVVCLQKDNRTLDSREQHFYLAKFWARSLSETTAGRDIFTDVFKKLGLHEQEIIADIAAVRQTRANLGGYFQPDIKSLGGLMRPSGRFNSILNIKSFPD